MNKAVLFPFVLAISLVAGNAYADAQPQEAPASSAVEPAIEPEIQDLKADQISLLSEAFGHMLAKHIQSLGINFDVAQLVKGLEDAHQGKTSPMDEMKCIEAIGQARQAGFLRLAQKNLHAAEQFMQETAKKDGVQAIEEGKLYFRIEHAGEGAAVAVGNSPLIRYKGSFIDGKVFGASKEDDLVALDETIQGFSRGLLGMKEGEKRTLYIHPELAYGTNGQLPPNSLLVFEIELIKAHSEKENSQSVTSSEHNDTSEKEISHNDTSSRASVPGEAASAVR